jgi:hypothetical protein
VCVRVHDLGDLHHRLLDVSPALVEHDVAVQVEFESKFRNQEITFKFQALKQGAFKLWVKLYSLAMTVRRCFPKMSTVAVVHTWQMAKKKMKRCTWCITAWERNGSWPSGHPSP